MSRTMSSSISNEDDITLCFQTAREKLDRVDTAAVGTVAWSVCPFSVIMDIPTVEAPNGYDGTLTVSPYVGCASLLPTLR